MNKQEFYNAFKKGVTCALTCLIIFFSAIFCFYAGYKLGRERVLDSDSNIVNTSNVQTHLINLQPKDSLEDSYNFLTNTFTIPVGYFASTNVNDLGSHSVSFLSFTVSLSYSSSSLFSCSLNTLYGIGDFGTENLVHFPYYSRSPYVNGTSHSLPVGVLGTSTPWTFNWIPINNFCTDGGNENLTYYLYVFAQRSSSSFNANVSRIVIDYSNTINGSSEGVLIYFYDNNNEFLQLQFYCSNAFVGYFDKFVPSRTIFINQNLTDNEYYNAGYDAGYTVGENNGIQSGYNRGYNAGDTVGYNRGYNAGVDAGNQYTFSSLLTAVIDAPVHVFIDLLDFNIMGYNLLNLVVGLLTFAVIVLILKLILGGK